MKKKTIYAYKRIHTNNFFFYLHKSKKKNMTHHPQCFFPQLSLTPCPSSPHPAFHNLSPSQHQTPRPLSPFPSLPFPLPIKVILFSLPCSPSLLSLPFQFLFLSSPHKSIFSLSCSPSLHSLPLPSLPFLYLPFPSLPFTYVYFPPSPCSLCPQELPV